ncbi:cobyrinate a,c-diamide synthase [Bacillaceae bacterium]
MAQRRIVIAGTGSGVGKTTLTIGIMAALKARGYEVQGFKCGPDYIDPTYHAAVTGRISRNLDSWMLDREIVKEIFVRAARDADIAIIEGVMGFYDGKDPATNEGSTAEISLLTQSPVVLVLNAQSMARSAAAIVKGFQSFCDEVRIAGVIVNKVSSERHFRIVQTAIEQECGIPVLGYLQRETGLEIPERHLGLVPSIERGELASFFQLLGERVAATVDLERLLAIAEAPPLDVQPRLFAAAPANAGKKRVRVAVAKDAAFHFYYPENLELLEAFGAECLYFSPLKGEKVPETADALYLGGGFPEEFAAELAANEAVKASVRAAIERGLPTLAECGGFMYLTEAVVTADGSRYSMVGIIPGEVRMQRKLAALGYREVRGSEGNFLLGPHDRARGHEFHYSTFTAAKDLPCAYVTKGLRGTKPEGCLLKNLVAGYTHLHFASAPQLVARWIEKSLQAKRTDAARREA